jgi:Protein of unknown function (DUF3109)
LIEIDNVLIGDEVIESQFVCDLSKCKGGCCEDGDAGAPLTEAELDIVNQAYETIIPYLTEAGKEIIETKGKFEYHSEFGWTTPTIGGKMCVYGFRDQTGTIKCSFEQAFYDGKIAWKKPISCHLYPIKIKKTAGHELVNYEPREKLCNPACELGEKLKVPTYVFLKDALIRKYGADFYNVLEQIAAQYYSVKQ